ncbi:hypothetical protein SAMN05444143_11054 [Flavobacterium succinicans]|uniref:Uncharacterized protein n=2 Tax=Flavobacterium TaxID=237 RepID=A0A1I4Y0Q9_9FLAO|nr:hypothetical protein SAMN05444143_11054 [Flavobacterium succinicans]
MPCADVEVNSAGHSLNVHQTDLENHSHDKSKDLCSPFCICNCCGSQITSFSEFVIIDFPIPSKGIKTQLPTYKSVFASNFFGSIWQPPQIA